MAQKPWDAITGSRAAASASVRGAPCTLMKRATRDSGIVALQHNRLMKLTLNHYDDALNPQTTARISAFLKSLKFLK